jgi:hypothetical protein
MKTATLTVVCWLFLGVAAALAASCPYCGRRYGDGPAKDWAYLSRIRAEHERNCSQNPKNRSSSGNHHSGHSGHSGYSGHSGHSGSGYSGHAGYSGHSGSGYSGRSGYSGHSGYSSSGTDVQQQTYTVPEPVLHQDPVSSDLARQWWQADLGWQRHLWELQCTTRDWQLYDAGVIDQIHERQDTVAALGAEAQSLIETHRNAWSVADTLRRESLEQAQAVERDRQEFEAMVARAFGPRDEATRAWLASQTPASAVLPNMPPADEAAALPSLERIAKPEVIEVSDTAPVSPAPLFGMGHLGVPTNSELIAGFQRSTASLQIESATARRRLDECIQAAREHDGMLSRLDETVDRLNLLIYQKRADVKALAAPVERLWHKLREDFVKDQSWITLKQPLDLYLAQERISQLADADKDFIRDLFENLRKAPQILSHGSPAAAEKLENRLNEIATDYEHELFQTNRIHKHHKDWMEYLRAMAGDAES